MLVNHSALNDIIKDGAGRSVGMVEYAYNLDTHGFLSFRIAQATHVDYDSEKKN